MRLQQFTLATSVATLFLASVGASSSFARGGKKEAGRRRPLVHQQAVRVGEQGRRPQGGPGSRTRSPPPASAAVREEQERKNKPPEKKVKVVDDPATATLPTMDIEKPAAPTREEAEEGRRRGAAASATRWTTCSTSRA